MIFTARFVNVTFDYATRTSLKVPALASIYEGLTDSNDAADGVKIFEEPFVQSYEVPFADGERPQARDDLVAIYDAEELQGRLLVVLPRPGLGVCHLVDLLLTTDNSQAEGLRG